MLTEEALYWIALHQAPGIGPKRFYRLLTAFGTAQGAWKSESGALAAVLGLQQARLQRDGAGGREVQRGALGTQTAEVGRVRRVAAHAGDLRPIAFDDDAAAYAAVGAGGPGFLHGGVS